MSAIFSRGADGALRQGVVGVLVAVGLGVLAFYYYALPSYTRVGYAPEQPVPFSHELHAGRLGLDCTYCHSHVFASPHANVPTSRVCLNCHDPSKANVKGNSPLLSAIRESVLTGQAVAWKWVHRLPDYAYFNHAIHVNKGVACVTCHGAVNEMPVIRHAEPLSMGWCLRCHADPTPFLRPVEGVTSISWKVDPEAGGKLHQALAVQAPMNCQSCHR